MTFSNSYFNYIKSVLFACLFALFLLTPHSLWSATITWTGTAGDNNWYTAANWDSASVPAGTDDAIIRSGGITINVNSSSPSINFNSLVLSPPSGSFILKVSTTIVAPSGNITIGNNANLQLNNSYKSLISSMTIYSGGIISSGTATTPELDFTNMTNAGIITISTLNATGYIYNVSTMTVYMISASSMTTTACTVTVTTMTISGKLTIDGTGTITHGAVDTRGLSITAGQIEIGSTGKIDIGGKGYAGGAYAADGTGPGKGLGSSSRGGSGAGYGGQGGNSNSRTGGVSYGVVNAIGLGSGGGGGEVAGYCVGGNGGGAVWVVASTVTVNGFVTANGNDGGYYNYGGGGGSGGGIYITADYITGIGTITANGGNGPGNGGITNGGGGGGGRIVILSADRSVFKGLISVNGGSGCATGSAGSKYFGVPSAPVNLILINGDDGSTVAWGSLLRSSMARFNVNLNGAYTGNLVKYNLNISTASNFSSLIINSTSTTMAPGTTDYAIVISSALNGPPCYLRVRSVTDDNVVSTWTYPSNYNATSFAIDALPPAGVGLSSITKCVSSYTITCSAGWDLPISSNSGLAALAYNIECSSSPTFVWVSTSTDWTNQTSATLGDSLSATTTYYFRVRARDNFGNISTSTIKSDVAVVYWTGSAGNNDWFTPANWDIGMVPGGGSKVIINASGQVNVAASSMTFLSLTLAPPSGTLSLVVSTAIAVPSGNITVGNNAVLKLNNSYRTIFSSVTVLTGGIISSGTATTPELYFTNMTNAGNIMISTVSATGYIYNSSTMTVCTIVASSMTTTAGTIIVTTITVSGKLTVGGTGIVTHGAVDARGLSLIAGQIEIGSKGKIDVGGMGYAGGAFGVDGTGTGKGLGDMADGGYARGGSGAGYGGNGGNSYRRTGGASYGTVSTVALGSGGGGGPVSGCYGGNGGGIVWMATPLLTINGYITSNGNAGGSYNYSGGGGSGGGIYIAADYITGIGTITANGGLSQANGGQYDGGGGAGGRIVILSTDRSGFSGVVAVNGGVSGYAAGGTGTIYYGVSSTPGKVTGLTASGKGQVALNWTAPGDDSYTGNVTNGMWEIRYSTRTNAAGDDAEYSLLRSSSYAQGAVYSDTITGLTNKSTYYFWLRARDESNHWSVWSDSVSVPIQNWYDNAWPFRRQIIVSKTMVSSTTLTNFPLLVKISSDTSLAAYAQSDGDDILITSSDTVTKLSHEIEVYDPAAGSLWLWTKVPVLSTTTDTTLYLYYGNNSCASQQNKNSVWDSNNKAVWHMNSTSWLDSTSNGYNGTGYNGVAIATGQVSLCGIFDGDNNYLTTSLYAPKPITITLWAKFSNVSLMSFLVHRWGSAYLQVGNSKIKWSIYNGSTFGTEAVSDTIDPNKWYHIAATWDGTSYRLYLNGDLNATGSNTGNYTPSGPLGIGTRSDTNWNDSGSDYIMNGCLDEIAISDAARTPQWIKTMFNNQSADYTTVNMPESVETIPPAAVTDLAGTQGMSEGNVNLTWSTPGDDGLSGTLLSGSRFAVQYSSWTDGISWSTGTAQVNLSTSSVTPGTQVNYTVTSLTGGTTYYFRMWTRDEVGNWSDISNGATTWAQVDVTAPGKIIGIAASGKGQVALNWTAPGDDSYTGNVTNGMWEIRYSTRTNAAGDDAEYSLLRSSSYAQGAVYSDTITGLTNKSTYYFWLRARDESNHWSVWSDSVSATLQNWYSDAWLYRRQITVSKTMVSSTTLTNFPMLVKIASDTLLAAYTQSNGNDILITSSDTVTKLPHEIESYTSATGELWLWTKVPVLSTTTDTTLYLYYGNTSCASQQNKNGVWDQNYVAVWHLYDAASPATDATINGLNATQYNGVTFGAAAPIKNGCSFDGSNDYLEVANTAKLNPPTQITVEMWFKPLETMTDYQGVLGKGGGSAFEQGYEFAVNGGSFGFWVNGGAHMAYTTKPANGSLSHWAGTYDGTTARLYKDGVNIHSVAYASSITSTSLPFRICCVSASGGNKNYTLAVVDEVRLSSVTRSADWIATSYRNQQDPSLYLNLSSQQLSDSIPPASITSLSATQGAKEGEIRLGWPAPGDDEWSTALPSSSMFAIQRSSWTDGIIWSTASAQVSVSTNSVVPGTQVYYQVTGLTNVTSYYFRLWHCDEVGNWSGLSNIATTWAQIDIISPGKVTGLTAQRGSFIQLSWTAPGDNGYSNNIVNGAWEFKYSARSNATSDDAEYSLVRSSSFTQGAVYGDVITGLAGQSTYYFWLRARDESNNWSVWSDSASAFVQNWYNDSWLYRMPLTVYNGVSSDLSDFQVGLVQNTKALYDAGKMQSSGADIRFSKSDSITECPYWIETVQPSTATSCLIWVKVTGTNSLPALSSTTIYMYYGNTSAVAVSSGPATFEQWDDFDDSVIHTGIWNTHVLNGGSFQETGGELVDKNDGNWAGGNAYTKKTFTKNQALVVDFDVRYPVANAGGGNQHYLALFNTSAVTWTDPNYDFPGNSASINFTGGNSITFDTRWRITLLGDGNYNLQRLNGSNYKTDVTNAAISNWAGISDPVVIDFYGGSYGGSTYWDDVRIRKYAALQPNINPEIEQVDDTDPPAAVTDLAATPGSMESSAKLTWSVPGDSGLTGVLSNGSLCRVQYSTATSEVNWSTAAAQVNFSTSSVTPGSQVTYTVTSLTGGATYYFRIWNGDEVKNWSGLSNIATTWAQIDVDAPGKVTGLTAQRGSFIQLSWTAPGDNAYSNNVTGGAWEIKYSTRSTASSADAEYSLIRSSSFTQGAVYSDTITGLTNKSTYYFWLRAGDESNNWSVWSDSVSAFVQTWYNDSWLYRMPLTVYNGAGSGLSDFQVGMVVNTKVLYDAGKMQLSGSDIRFTKSDNVTECPYWIETVQPSTATSCLVWVKVTGTNSLPALSSSTIYMFYGNASAVAASSGPATFEVWDDFNDNSIHTGIWSTHVRNGGAVSEAGGEMVHDDDGDWAGENHYTVKTFSKTQPLIIDFDIRYPSAHDSGGDQHRMCFFNPAQATWTDTYYDMPGNSASIDFCTWSGLVTYDTRWRIILFGDGNYSLQRLGGTNYLADVSNQPVTGWSTPNDPIVLDFNSGTYGNKDTYWDDIRVRKYAPVITNAPQNSEENVDALAPAPVTDLAAAQGSIEGCIQLGWSAPGDDGLSGALPSGSRFAVQYSSWTSGITWSTGTAQVNLSTSSVTPNTQVNYTVTSLTGGTTYYFRMWTRDESGNWSGISNGATTWAQVIIDVTAPGKITGITASGKGQVSLNWTASGDDSYTGNVTNGMWEIHYSTRTNAAGDDAEYSLLRSSSYTQGTVYSDTITGLTNKSTYYFWLRARDENNNWSVWSDSVSVTLQNWYSDAWLYRRQITVSKTMVSSTTLTNFPLLVKISSDTSLAAYAQSNGNDILITSSDTVTKLSHEIEKYISSTGELCLWTKVPVLSTTTDTTLYLYYGNTSCGSQQDKNSVWDSNYRAVWHLGDTGTTAYDSTVNSNNGARSGNVLFSTTSIIGQGCYFDGSNNTYLDCGTGAGLNPSVFALECWVKIPVTAFKCVVSRTPDFGYSRDYLFYLGDTGAVSFSFGNNSSQFVDFSTGPIATNVWYHIVTTRNGSEAKIFINGNECKTSNYAFTPGNQNYRTMLGGFVGSYSLNGNLDEVRISNTARSADWILTSYRNQSLPGTYMNVTQAESAETIPPAEVTDLAGTQGASEGKVMLTWSAPGDDGLSGTLPSGSRFAVQYSSWTSGIVWSTGTAQVNLSTSSVTPGMQVNYTVTSLTGGTTYYFRVWHCDEMSNWSGISNGATTWAQVNVVITAPGKVTGLAAVSGNQANLSWTAPGNDSYSGNVTGGMWRIRYSSQTTATPDTAGYTVDRSSSFAQGSKYGEVLTGLQVNVTYYFWISARNGSGNWSVWSDTTSLFVVNYPWFSGGWPYRKQIVISKSMVANTTQNNFPVLIKIASDPHLAAWAQSGGGDLVFTSSNSVKLAHEIEKYVNTTGELWAWVKVPVLSPSEDTVLYLYYGNSTCASQQDKNNVWDTKYKGVWHLGDSGTTAYDSTSNGNNGTQSGGVTFSASGQVKNGCGFDGSNDYIEVPNFITAYSSFTFSFWMNITAFTNGDYMSPFSQTQAQYPPSAYVFAFYSGNNANSFGLNAIWTDGTECENRNTIPFGTGVWKYVTVSYDGYTVKKYVDGALNNQNSYTGKIIGNSLPIHFGMAHAYPGSLTTAYFSGSLDEINVSNASRSADWVITAYRNQSSPSTYINPGQQEDSGGSSDSSARRKRSGMFLIFE